MQQRDDGFNLRQVFIGLSEGLHGAFTATRQVGHHGGRGAGREDAFAEFLREYLPRRYGVGKGEAIHWSQVRSHQLDVVLHDPFECPRLFVQESHSVFPVESVFGAIEVKSDLTAGELEKAYENLASLKRLAPAGVIQQSSTPGFAVALVRGVPYGAVFAYSATRSLDAILAQATKLERLLSEPSLAPDAIVVLNRGIVSRLSPIRDRVHGLLGAALAKPLAVRNLGKHTLLRFYMEMLRELNAIPQEPLDLNRYTRMPELVDGHRVSGHNHIMRRGDTTKMYKIGAPGLRRIIEHCRAAEPVTMAQHLRSIVPNAEVPPAIAADDRRVQLFNPLGRTYEPGRPFAPFTQVLIEDELYMVDVSALGHDDIVEDDDVVFDEAKHGL